VDLVSRTAQYLKKLISSVAEKPGIPGKVILHREGEHYRHPEETSDSRQPDQPRAPVDVHKKQHYTRHFEKSDAERYQCVGTRKDPVEVLQCHYICDYSSDKEDPENDEVSGYTDMLFFRMIFRHHYSLVYKVPPQQIEQRKQEDPDNIDKMPV
jgi:hypothetical protein